MQNSKSVWIAVVLLAVVTITLILDSKRFVGSEWAVKTYVVPADRVDEVKTSLNRLFAGKDGETSGNAQVFGSGLMLVRAPEGYQKGVAQLIDQLGSEKPRPQTTIHLDYWLIAGQEDKKSNIDAIPALSNVLSTIDKLDGPRKYRILEHLSSNSTSGGEVAIHGAAVESRSIAWMMNESVRIRLEFHSKMGDLKTDTQLKPGEFLVLGQNAIGPDARIGDEKVVKGAPTNAYYVVRAEVSK